MTSKGTVEFRLEFLTPSGSWGEILTSQQREDVDDYVRRSPWPATRYRVESRTVSHGPWVPADPPPDEKDPSAMPSSREAEWYS